MNWASSASRTRRSFEAAAFVGVWMALGLAFHLGPNPYLLTGIPLTLLFQLFVRRRPLTALWVSNIPAFRLSRAGVVYALGFAAVPIFQLSQTLNSYKHPRTVATQPFPWVLATCFVLACLGAIPAAYAFQNFRRSTWKYLGLCFATAGAIAVVLTSLGFLAARAHSAHAASLHPFAALETGTLSFLGYLPWIFLVEEVLFRGLLDSHVHHPGEPHGFWSALFVSALWGIWHYPVVGRGHPLAGMIPVILYQCLVGVPLSVYWRKSGNLGVPGTVHAFVDGVRNALMQLAR